MNDASSDTHPSPDEMPRTVLSQVPVRTLGGVRLLARVGQGGMGEVWVGMDEKLHRKVAVKMMRQDLARTPDSVARFYQEARAVAKLNHPAITQIFQIGEESGLLFFAMEWVEGASVSDYLKKHGPMPPRWALELVQRVVEGLEFALKNNVIHRDIKPANLMLSNDGAIKITDFGLAKIMDTDTALTSSGVSMGSPNYMAPEMCRGETVDHRADIYSLGITLYQMLTGRMPFTGASATAVIWKQIQEDLPVTEDMYEQLGPPMVELLLRMTNKSTERRFTDYPALKEHISEVLDSYSKSGTVRQGMPRLSAQELEKLSLPTHSARPVSPGDGELQKTPGAVRRLRPALLAIPAALLVVAALAAWLVLGSGDGASVAPPPSGSSISGEVFLKMERGVDAIAGQSIYLYGGPQAAQLRAKREQMDASDAAITQLASSLRPLLKEVRTLITETRNMEALEAELATLRADEARLKPAGVAATEKVARLDAAVKELRAQYEEFGKLPYDSFPITDPLTGRQYTLSGLPAKKDESDRFFQGLIQRAARELSDAQTDLKTLSSKYTSTTERLATLRARINVVADATTSGLIGRKRDEFKAGVKELARLRRGLAAEAAALGNAPGGWVSRQVVGKEGEFSFAGVATGDYALLVHFDWSWQEQNDGYLAVWIVDEEVGTTGSEKVRLSQENLVYFARHRALEFHRREATETDLDRNLDIYLQNPADTALVDGFGSYLDHLLEQSP